MLQRAFNHVQYWSFHLMSLNKWLFKETFKYFYNCVCKCLMTHGFRSVPVQAYFLSANYLSTLKNWWPFHESFSNVCNSHSISSVILTKSSIYSLENRLWDWENQMKVWLLKIENLNNKEKCWKNLKQKQKNLNCILGKSTNVFWTLTFKTKTHAKHQRLKIQPKYCNLMMPRNINEILFTTYNNAFAP